MHQDKEPLVFHAGRIVDTYQELESPRIDKICFYEMIVRPQTARETDLGGNCLIQRRWGHFPHVLLG